MMRRFDAETALDLIERGSTSHRPPWRRFTSCASSSSDPELVGRYDMSSVSWFVVHSASPVAPALKRQIIDLFPDSSLGNVWGH